MYEIYANLRHWSLQQGKKKTKTATTTITTKKTPQKNKKNNSIGFFNATVVLFFE